MPERETIKSAVPGSVYGRAFISALKIALKKISPWNSEQSGANVFSHGPDFEDHKWPSELQGVIESLVAVRRRILTNVFLRDWMKSWTWILAGLIVAAALSPKLTAVVILAGVLAIVGAVAIVIRTWRTRPSAYDAACRLDSAANLRDRVSTAVYLGAVGDPSEMILRQRQDALTHVAKLDPPALFPVRMPSAARRALVLAMVTAVFFVYRSYYKPPIVALLQTTARSQFVQSILSPIAYAMEKDLQRAMSIMSSSPDLPADQVRPGDPKMAEQDVWQALDEQGNDAESAQQDSPEDNNLDGQKPNQLPRSPGEMKPGDQLQQQEGDQESADSQQGSQNSENSRQSLPQSLMDALKNMMSKTANQQKNQQAGDAQGAAQSGNSHQPGSMQSDQKGDSKGSSDSQQKSSQNTGSGAGSQEGTKGLLKDHAALPVRAVPERVALESTGYKEQTRVRNETGTGTAQLPVRNVSPQAAAVVNGAEQENIPARYRLYVQHYFEHADTDSGQK